MIKLFQRLADWISKKEKERKLEKEYKREDTLTEISWTEPSVPKTDVYGNSIGPYS